MSIKDIAEATGLSVATVSRVINNQGNVSETSRNKVLSAIQDSGYVPNLLGRSLRTSKTFKILVLLPSISNPFYSKIIRGIKEKAKSCNYNVLIAGTELSKEQELNNLEMLKTRQVDGAILFLSSITKDELSELGSEYPVVQCCEYTPGAQVSYVSINNEQAAYDAVEVMIQKGRTRVGAIVGDMYFASEASRLRGYRRALMDYNIPYDENLIVRSTYSYQGGYDGVVELEKRNMDYDALFCFSDTIAMGASKRLQSRGVNVGKDIFVVGFDNLSICQFTSPTLSTIYQPRMDLGETAFELLMEKIVDIKSKTMGVLLPHQLILRESTGDSYQFGSTVKEEHYYDNL